MPAPMTRLLRRPLETERVVDRPDCIPKVEDRSNTLDPVSYEPGRWSYTRASDGESRRNSRLLVRLLYRWSRPPRHLELVRGDRHRRDVLLEDRARVVVTDAILRFLERYSPRSA